VNFQKGCLYSMGNPYRSSHWLQYRHHTSVVTISENET